MLDVDHELEFLLSLDGEDVSVKAERISDDALAVRGGRNRPNDIEPPAGVLVTPP